MYLRGCLEVLVASEATQRIKKKLSICPIDM